MAALVLMKNFKSLALDFFHQQNFMSLTEVTQLPKQVVPPGPPVFWNHRFLPNGGPSGTAQKAVCRRPREGCVTSVINYLDFGLLAAKTNPAEQGAPRFG